MTMQQLGQTLRLRLVVGDAWFLLMACAGPAVTSVRGWSRRALPQTVARTPDEGAALGGYRRRGVRVPKVARPARSVAVGIAILIVAFWHWRHVTALRSSPISPLVADILPNMLQGLEDLERHHTPYRPHAVPWLWYNYYLPATFLPFYLPYKLGIDVRWMTVACLDVVNLVLAVFVWRWPRRLGAYIAVTTAIGLALDLPQFVRIVHLGPSWLYAAVAFTLLTLGSHWSAAAFALALAAREDALVYCVVPALAVLKHCGSSGRRLALGAVMGAALLCCPFAIADPWFYAGTVRSYESVTWIIEKHGGQDYVGFAGPLYQVGLLGWRWPLLGLGLAALACLYAARSRAFDGAEVTRYAGVSALLFALFALVPFPYVYIASAIIFGVAALGSRGLWAWIAVGATAAVMIAATTNRAIPEPPDPCAYVAAEYLMRVMPTLDRYAPTFVEQAKRNMATAGEVHRDCLLK